MPSHTEPGMTLFGKPLVYVDQKPWTSEIEFVDYAALASMGPSLEDPQCAVTITTTGSTTGAVWKQVGTFDNTSGHKWVEDSSSRKWIEDDDGSYEPEQHHGKWAWKWWGSPPADGWDGSMDLPSRPAKTAPATPPAEPEDGPRKFLL